MKILLHYLSGPILLLLLLVILVWNFYKGSQANKATIAFWWLGIGVAFVIALLFL